VQLLLALAAAYPAACSRRSIYTAAASLLMLMLMLQVLPSRSLLQG
jgi:hypothetical protein